MATPKVSIVIPTYNREAYLPRTLASAAAQTYGNIEIIVCDNASADGTADLVEAFRRRHPATPLRYIRHETNIGPVRNWFSGVAAADGEFVKILFSDDYLPPGSVAALVRPLVDAPFAFSYGKVHNLTQEGGRVTNYGRLRPGHRVTAREYISAFFASYLAPEDYPNSPCAALIRTDVLRATHLEPYTHAVGFDVVASGIGPDMLMFLHGFLATGQDAVYVNDTVAAFQGHAESITITSTLDRLDDHNFAAVLLFYALLPEGSPLRAIFERCFDALAAKPSYFRRPEARLALLEKSGCYRPKPMVLPFPYAHATHCLARRVQRAVEYRAVRLARAFGREEEVRPWER